VRVSSIVVAQTSGNLTITTTHTPSNAIMIQRADVDDLMTALNEALRHLEGPP